MDKYVRGEHHHEAKASGLTKRKVANIRKLYDTIDSRTGRRWALRDLARKYGVSHVTISKIVMNESWKV